MRLIIRILIAIFWLGIIAFFGISYLNAPSQEEKSIYDGLMKVTKQAMNNEPVDVNAFTGTSEDSKFMRIFAEYLDVRVKVNKELAKQRNFLQLLVQPTSLAATQSLDVSLEKIGDYNKKLAEINQQREDGVEQIKAKLNALDRKALKLDVVTFLESLDADKKERETEMQYYAGLSQYVQAIIQFCQSRVGYYQQTETGSIRFTTEADQAYFKQLIDGMNQYIKAIDTLNEQRNSKNRKSMSGLAF